MSNLKKFSGIRISTKTKILLIVLCVIALYFVPYVIRGQYWGRIINQAIVNMLVVLGLNLLSGYLGLLNVGASGMVAVGAYTAALLATRLGVPMILETDAKSKCEKYVHLGMELAETHDLGAYGKMYDLIKYPKPSNENGTV